LEDLRRLLAEYHATLQSYTEEDERKVLQLGTELDLMLNLDEPAQKALWDIADRLFDAEDIAQRREMDKELMAAGRVVLKAEWNKIKWELRGKPLDEAAKHATTVALKE
jgi:hypothetical protein